MRTVSCLFHHSFGRPVPAKLDGAPFARLPRAPSKPLPLGVVPSPPPKRTLLVPVAHGSSVMPPGERPGAATVEVVFCRYVGGGGGWNVETDGTSELRSSLGSGRSFRDDNAATCSMLTSVH